MSDDQFINIEPIAITYTPIDPKFREGEALNRILRGEHSAVEAYETVLEHLHHKSEVTSLYEVLAFHRRMVDRWTIQVSKTLVGPNETSGPWGYIVDAIVKSAVLLGDNSSLRVLKEGEEHGLKEYEMLLTNQCISKDIIEYVNSSVIPTIGMNMGTLDVTIKKLND